MRKQKSKVELHENDTIMTTVSLDDSKVELSIEGINGHGWSRILTAGFQSFLLKYFATVLIFGIIFSQKTKKKLSGERREKRIESENKNRLERRWRKKTDVENGNKKKLPGNDKIKREN